MSPVSSPCQNGEEVESIRQVGQEIACLVHQIDTQLVVLDAGVNVHPANCEPPADAGEVARQRLVARLRRGLERRAVGERVGGSRDRCQAEVARDAGNRPAQVGKLAPVPS